MPAIMRTLLFALLSTVLALSLGAVQPASARPHIDRAVPDSTCKKVSEGDAIIASIGSCIDEPVQVQSSRRSAARSQGTQPLNVYKCGRWKKQPFTRNYFRDCARFSRMNKKFDLDYQTDFQNKFWRQSVEWRCKHAQTTTWKFSFSATVKAEAGVIFAKAEVSATAGVERSVTSEDSADFKFKIGPRKWAWCKRGGYEYKIKGNVRTQHKRGWNGKVSWWKGTYQDFWASAPSHTRYSVGPGRL